MGIRDRLFGAPRERFARQVLTAIRDAGVAQAWYVPEQFAIAYRLRSAEDGQGMAFLHNVYRECVKASRSERRERIAHYLSGVINYSAELPDDWAGVAPMLRPVLRPVTFGLGVWKDMAPVSRPAMPYVAEFVVIDQPTSMAYVTSAHLESWGVSPGMVFSTARTNLRALTGSVDPAPAADPPALIRMVETGDAYWSSRLLQDGWLAGFAGRVGGRPVAFAPDTTGVLIVADDPAALPAIFELAEQEYREAARQISPQAYTVDDAGRLVQYTAPDGHPLAAAVHRASVILAGAEYGSQADVLNKELEDVFVATYMVGERPDGSLFSVGTWGQGVDTLLPRTDYVAMSGEHTEPFYVTWEVLGREVDLEPVDGLAPERYRLPSWPHPGVVERLRAQASTP